MKRMNTLFFDHLVEKAAKNNKIDPSFYHKYEVKTGLRNENGTGVLVGLTEVGSVHGYEMKSGVKIPTKGSLFYRGINIEDIVHHFQVEKRRGFEETIYLLLFGKLPTLQELEEFNNILDENRPLPCDFTENMILKNPSKDIMNKLQRSILVLYSHDTQPDDTSLENILRQCIKLIASFPTIVSYGYQAKMRYFNHASLYLHSPQAQIGTAENLLYMIRPDTSYTSLEAEILDLCLVIHAEHGGGNNSTFATHVVSSSGTDTYSAISSAVGCLKGHKHGGANIKVRSMIQDIKVHCADYHDKNQLTSYLKKILNKEAFNGEGLIYGMGHAVYTLSDPRAMLLKSKAYELAIARNSLEEFNLYADIENCTKEIFSTLKGDDFKIAANVDLYSGFVYEMLNIPPELYTPIFAIARVAGWCAHRMEQLISDKRIIRPAFKAVAINKSYELIRHRI